MMKISYKIFLEFHNPISKVPGGASWKLALTLWNRSPKIYKRSRWPFYHAGNTAEQELNSRWHQKSSCRGSKCARMREDDQETLKCNWSNSKTCTWLRTPSSIAIWDNGAKYLHRWFCLKTSDNRHKVWRRANERYFQYNIVSRLTFNGGSIMVWRYFCKCAYWPCFDY